MLAAAELVKDTSIDRVGFSQLSRHLGEEARPSGVYHRDGDTHLVSQSDQPALAASGGFAEEVDALMLDQEFKEPAEAGLGVGYLCGQTLDGAVEVDVALGDIGSEVDDCSVHG